MSETFFATLILLHCRQTVAKCHDKYFLVVIDEADTAIKIDTSLDDAVVCACPFLAIDLLRKLVTLFS